MPAPVLAPIAAALVRVLPTAIKAYSAYSSYKSSKATKAHQQRMEQYAMEQIAIAQGQQSVFESMKSLGQLQAQLALTQQLSVKAVNAAADRLTAEKRLQHTMMRQPSGMNPAKLKQMSQFADDQQKRSSISAVTGITGMTELGKSVMNPDHVMKLTRSMYDLAAGTYGARVSQEQLVQTASLMGSAMNGQLAGLQEMGFEITEQQAQLMSYGTEAERTQTLMQILGTRVGGMAAAMANTPTGKIEQLRNAWTGVLETIGTLLMPAVMQFVDFLMEKMPAIQDFMVGAFTAINGAIWFVIDVIGILFNFIQDNWSWLQPLLLAILAVYISGIIMGLLLMAGAWLIMASPILLVIGIVYGLIMLFKLFGVSAQDVVAVIMNRFGMFFGFLRNGVAALWNGFATLAEFLGNLFKDPVFAIKQLFFNMAIEILERLRLFATMVEGMVGKAVGVLQKIGIDIDLGTGATFMSSKLQEGIDKLKKDQPTSDKDTFSLNRMEYKNPFEEGEKWAAYSNGLFDKAGKAYDNFKDGFGQGLGEDLAKWPPITPPETPEVPTVPSIPGGGREPNIGQVGRVGEVGKIDKEVDISQEDLKLMRDLAEIKAIQNFVTLTPTVQVTTGDIVEKADLDEMIRRFQQSMEQEIAYAARGVYG